METVHFHACPGNSTRCDIAHSHYLGENLHPISCYLVLKTSYNSANANQCPLYLLAEMSKSSTSQTSAISTISLPDRISMSSSSGVGKEVPPIFFHPFETLLSGYVNPYHRRTLLNPYHRPFVMQKASSRIYKCSCRSDSLGSPMFLLRCFT